MRDPKDNTSRLTALDGLRGFCAFVVAMTHFNLPLKLPQSAAWLEPYFFPLYRSLQEGHAAVTAFFVLCGFFMALLYSNKTNTVAFLLKRYLRIFPLYIFCVFYLHVTNIANAQIPRSELVASTLGYLNIFFIFVTVAYLAGRYLLWAKSKSLLDIAFWSYIALQIIALLFVALYVSRSVVHGQLELSKQAVHYINFIAQLTLTSPLSRGLELYEPPFWSLHNEVIFYILYPTVLLPIVANLHRLSWPKRLFVFTSSIAITLLLSHGLDNMLHTKTIMFYRSVGFVAGIAAAHIYKSEDILQKLKPWLKNKLSNIVILAMFGALFVLYWRFPETHNWQNYLAHSVVTSIAFAFLILCVLCARTWLTQILETGPLVLLGKISYSLYLSHHVIAKYIMDNSSVVRNPEYFFVLNIVYIVLCIVLASILYQAIESFYFDKRLSQILKKASTPTTSVRYLNMKRLGIFISGKLATPAKTGILLALLIYIFQYDIAFSQSPAFISSKLENQHTLTRLTKLRNGQVYKTTFTPPEHNMSIIYKRFYFVKDSGVDKVDTTASKIVFRLLDRNDSLLSASVYDPILLEGSSLFPIAIDMQKNSKNTTYTLEIKVDNLPNGATIYADNLPSSTIATHQLASGSILTKIFYKVKFAITNIYVFCILTLAAAIWIVFNNPRLRTCS